jgi:hypothetical protein
MSIGARSRACRLDSFLEPDEKKQKCRSDQIENPCRLDHMSTFSLRRPARSIAHN